MLRQKSLPLQKRYVSGVVRQIILSWLFAVMLEYLCLPGALRDLARLDGLAQMSLIRVIAVACGGILLLSVISRFVNPAKVERRAIVGVFGILSIAALRASFTWAFFAVCILILIFLVVFGFCRWDGQPEPAAKPKQAHRVWLWITVGLSIAFFLFVSAWAVGRVYSFSTPTFDFGIFCQMFYNMKESGLPMTTVERDGLLSHFAVHVSPIYYLLLPFYALVPTPATLQVLQAAVITSAVIPLWKIGKYQIRPDQRIAATVRIQSPRSSSFLRCNPKTALNLRVGCGHFCQLFWCKRHIYPPLNSLIHDFHCHCEPVRTLVVVTEGNACGAVPRLGGKCTEKYPRPAALFTGKRFPWKRNRAHRLGITPAAQQRNHR